MATPALFTPVRMRALEIPNRIAVSPMCQYNALDGCPQDWHLVHLGQFAMGGAGLVMTEATHVSREGRITHGCAGLYNDESEAAFARIVKFVRRYGSPGTKVGVQIAHAGRKASAQTPFEGGNALGPSEQPWTTRAPSAVPFADKWHTPEALDLDGIKRVQREFVDAVRRAHRAGFDVVELHGAHGYLGHQFLSPIANRRTDDYGGSLQNRMRFLLETFSACRGVWPIDKPMGVRLSATDWVEGGWTIEDTVALARELKALGCDFVDVSSGGMSLAAKVPVGPGYQTHLAGRVKREANIATWSVGMIVKAQQAENIVAGGDADMVALGRSLMLNPRWPWFAAQALGHDLPLAPRYARAHPKAWAVAFPEGGAGQP